MMNADDVPVVIHHDACTPEGEELAKGGQPGWTEKTLSFDAARTETDIYGLKKVREALEEHARIVQRIWVFYFARNLAERFED
ncbi:MAG: hypothetical protein M1812_001857 [Candelaria pacifica]|nr:MAG: hypothetical protein M1812_001857 [Candelaria pacifica]